MTIQRIKSNLIKKSIKPLLVMFFLLFSGKGLSATKEQIAVKVGLAPPYITQSQDGNLAVEGLATQIVRESLLAKGLNIDIATVDWSQAKVAVDSEKVLSFWWQSNQQREKSWLYSQPLYEVEYVFLARKDVRFYWTRFDQLRSYKIGLSHIQSYGELFDSYVQYLDTDKTLSDFSAIKKLLANQLDAILIEKAMAVYLISFLPKEQQAKLELFREQVIHSESYYLVCGKFFNSCGYYINQFNEGLKLLKSSGRYNKIVNIDKANNED